MTLLIVFQSTRPVRGATDKAARLCYGLAVSIHAPRAGRDVRFVREVGSCDCFNPRAPCGARPARVLVIWFFIGFQSTRPVRGATYGGFFGQSLHAVSIHAPRAGRDA